MATTTTKTETALKDAYQDHKRVAKDIEKIAKDIQRRMAYAIKQAQYAQKDEPFAISRDGILNQPADDLNLAGARLGQISETIQMLRWVEES